MKYSEAVKKLVPVIQARRQEIEDARRLPADLARELHSTGIFALGVPKAIGGVEAPPADLMRVIETISAADGSTGWVTMIGISGGEGAGYMDETGAKEVFSDPTAASAVIVAPMGAAVRVDGGVRITGRWMFASGIDNCEWICVGAMIHANGAPVMTPHGPEIIHAYMRVAEGQIHDTWLVSGMSGTGSNDFSCSEVFVPDQRIFNVFDPSGHRSEPLYRMPVAGLFVSGLASVSLGIARAALDEFTELTETKFPTLSQVPLADKPTVQIELARAEAALGGARSFLYDTVEDVWQTVSAGREPTKRQIAFGRTAAVQAVETSAEVARKVNILAGGGAIRLATSLQRHARDAEAILHHFTQSQHTWEDAGRVLLGREPTVPVF
jgi:alkylation response protein AidB-like acyl-CoA dehydrogenase